MNIINTTDPEVPAKLIAENILKKLGEGKKVLWFMTGGSAISVQVLVAKMISERPHANLTITFTDERFGPVGHKDSNYTQTLEKGFDLKDAKIITILNGKSREETVKDFEVALEKELGAADYKIGLFGVGPDGHTSGIMPKSDAVFAQGLAFGYQAPNFERITITKNTIAQLDVALAWIQGKEKWWVIKDLEEKNIDIFEQPAQILKLVPEFTIFSDYQKE